MFNFIKRLFGAKQPEKVAKVEEDTPVASRTPTMCGCGRSPIGICVGLHRLSEEEWAVHEKNPNRVDTAAVKAKKTQKKPVKKAPAKTSKKTKA